MKQAHEAILMIASTTASVLCCAARPVAPRARRIFCCVALAGASLLSACSAQGDLSTPGGTNDLGCASTSNCVNSFPGSDLAAIGFVGPADKAMYTVLSVLAAYPQAQVTFKDALHVEAVFTTTLGFKDDVSFRIDPSGQRIDFRSRSRLGKYDFGKNRSRMKELAALFSQQGQRTP